MRPYYDKIKTSVDMTNYLYHISKRYKILYVENPKVACSTIKYMLQWAELGDDCELKTRHISSIHNRSLSPLLSPKDDPVVFQEAVWGGYFKFCFVRNPYVRTLSCFLDKIGDTDVVNQERARMRKKLGLSLHGPVLFYDFLLAILKAQQSLNAGGDPHWLPQSMLLSIDAIEYSFIGRHENLANDLRKLDVKLGGKFVVNKSSHATGAGKLLGQYYSKKEIELVGYLFNDDFKNFSYGKDIYFAEEK